MEKYINFIQEQIMILYKLQCSYILKELEKDIAELEIIYNNEIVQWQNKFIIKLLILGAAPLSSAKYFYKKPGNFLSGLKKHLRVEKDQLLQELRKKGIFVLDIYKYPIETKYYDNDKKHCLFDDGYIGKKLKDLTDNKMLVPETRVVFRYKKLIDRKLFSKTSLKNLNYLTKNNNHVILNKNEWGDQKLTDEVVDFLKHL